MTAATAQSSPLSTTKVELFRLFTEEGRLQVLALCAEEALTVTELAHVLEDSQPQISRRVTALRDAGLLEGRRDGARVFLRAVPAPDVVVSEAVAEGRRLCMADGSLSRLPAVLAAREESALKLFDAAPSGGAVEPSTPEHLAHLAALAPLLPGQRLAIDVGTGDGLVLDVLGPLFQRIIAVDRSQARLAQVAERIVKRGFHHVSLFPGSYDDAALVERVDAAGGADLVLAARTLHHAGRPSQAVAAFARLLKKGGHLIVLDYLQHQDDSLRTEHGDVWAGFSPKTMLQLFTDAGLKPTAEVPIPAHYHPVGPDAQLTWHAWAAQKPAGPSFTT